MLILSLIFIYSLCAAQEFAGESSPVKVDLVYQKPSLSMEVSFSSPDQFMDAGQKAAFLVKIKNSGPGKAYDVKASLSGQYPPGLTIEGAKDIGMILPGESRTESFILSADDTLPDKTVLLSLDIAEKFKQDPPPVEISLACRAVTPPDIILADNRIITGGSGISYSDSSGIVARGETIEVPVLIQNVGKGEALGVTAEVELCKGLVPTAKTEFSLGDMSTGESKKITFAFSVPETYRGESRLPILIHLREKKNRYGKDIPLPKPVEIGRMSPVGNFELKPARVAIRGIDANPYPVIPRKLDLGVDMDIPVTGNEKREAFAVVIGNRDYRDSEILPVEFALNDARIMAEYLVKVFGYRRGNVFLLENATFAQFREWFGTETSPGKLSNLLVNGRSDVFVYYSGHGAPDSESKLPYKLFFVPVDCSINPTSLKTNGYPLELFYQKLAALPARSVIVALDACFSGISGSSPIGLEITDPVRQIRNGILFTSSARDQISNWYRERKHGLFTYVFLKSLKDLLGSGKKTVTAGDIFAFLSNPEDGIPYLARSLYNGRNQTPQFSGDPRRVLVEVP
jgi:hypothetical protein